MTAVLLELPAQHWECPNCEHVAVSRRVAVGPGESTTEFHHCRGMAGMWAPMVPEGTKAKSVAVEREDYIGGDDVRTDGEGRPVMAVSIVRDEGEDRAVYAPCVNARLGDVL